MREEGKVDPAAPPSGGRAGAPKNLKYDLAAIVLGFLFLNAGTYVASGVTSELHALLFSQDGILSGIRLKAWAALSVAWVPAFMHGLVGGFAAVFLTSRVVTHGSLRITAVSVLVVLFAVSAYEIVSLGEAIGMLRRVEIYLAALGAALGVAAGYALERTKRRSS